MYIRVDVKKNERWIIINVIYENINSFINRYISE